MPWKPSYVDDQDLADFVRAAVDDPYVGTYGTAACRAVDDLCNRQFGRFDSAVELTYDGCYAALMGDRWLVMTDDIPDLAGTTVTVDGTSVAAGVDGYQGWPRNAVATGTPYLGLTFATRPYGDVVVENRFGWLAIPAQVTAAVWLQVNRWHIRRESPYGTAGSPAEGSEVRLSARLDPDVRAVLRGGAVVRSRMPK